MPTVSNPKVMMGKPTVAGTRIMVESILERLAGGESEVQILEANPRLRPDDIRAASASGVTAAAIAAPLSK